MFQNFNEIIKANEINRSYKLKFTVYLGLQNR